jgi:hypothetical protein
MPARRHRFTTLATLALAFLLATGGGAVTASTYTRLLQSAMTMPPATPVAPTSNNIPSAWQPAGCVFPGARTFAGR